MINTLDIDDILVQRVDDELPLINNAPINLNNVNDFFVHQKNIFPDNSFSDVEEEEVLPEYDAKNISPWSLNNEGNFTFEPEMKENIIPVYNEILVNKENDFMKKINDFDYFSKENENNNFNGNNKDNENNEKSENSNSIDEPINYESEDDYDEQGEDIIIPISDNENDNIDEIIINEQKDNKEEEKEKNINLNNDYPKEFFAFTKGGCNSYVNEIVNLINNDHKKHENVCKNIDGENANSKLIGKKRKTTKKKRRDKPDDIRKKLKSRFHKLLKKRLNYLLRKAGSKKEFDFMPQSFVSIIAKKPNQEVMNMKFKNLLKKNFIKDYSKFTYHKPDVDNKKYKKNLETLEYLENNIEIKKKAKFDIIGEMKYWELLEEFFYSREFENTVCELKKFERTEYIKEYVNKARTYVKFFSMK